MRAARHRCLTVLSEVLEGRLLLALPTGWSDADIGSPSLAGSANYTSGTWTVSGSGADIWNNTDQFNFASESMVGNGYVIARVASLTNTNGWAKAGVMIRDSSAAASMFADVLITPGNGVSFQWRNATSGACGSVQTAGVTAPRWVKLSRSGDSFTAFYSTDGSTWSQVGGSQTVGMSYAALAGLAVTSHDNTQLATASITNVSVTTLATMVNVDVGQVVRTANSNIEGINLAWWDSSLNTTQTVQMAQAAGLTDYRFPGGSSSDQYHFTDPSSYYWGNSIATIAKFIASANGGGLATLNYGTGSPQEAAALLAYLNATTSSTVAIGYGQQWNATTLTWVQKDWKTSGYWASLRAATPLATDDGLNFLRIGRSAPFAFHYYEIGNEVMGSWETDEHGSGGDTGLPHDPATYISFCKQFATYAQQIDPTISIGIVADGTNSWTVNTLQQCASQGFTPGYLSDHTYVGAPGSENDNTLLMHTSADPTSGYYWPTKAAGIRALITQYLGAAGNNIEMLETEFNNVYSNPGKQSTSLVNGLYVADSLGSMLESGYNGGWLWDLRNGWDTSNNNSASLYGWRQGGDYGILGGGSNTSAPSSGPYIPYPTYFSEQLISKLCTGGDIVVSANSNDPYLDTYVVRQKNGHLDLLVINKSSGSDISGTFNLTGFNASGQATFWRYGKVEDTAQSLTTDGHSALTTFSTTLPISNSSFSYTFPSYSMAAVDLTPSALPAGWTDGDVGSPALAGFASANGNTWTVQGAGTDIANASDQFNYASSQQSGDFAIIAHVDRLSNTDTWAKAGVMIRAGTAANAPFAMLVQMPNNEVSLQWRTSSGGSVSTNGTRVGGTASPKYLKLIRSGNVFTGYYSTDNITWTQVGSPVTITMNPQVNAGWCVTSRNTGAMASATFSHTLIVAAPAVTSKYVNDNSAQRSMVTSAHYTFSSPVTMGGSAFTLTRRRDGLVVGVSVSNPSLDQMNYVLTFTGSSIIGGSLADGGYNLTLTASAVTDAYGQHLTGGDSTFRIFRLFGDVNGDRQVTRSDLVAFRAALNQPLNYVAYFDYNNDLLINATDYTQFRLRLTRPLL